MRRIAGCLLAAALVLGCAEHTTQLIVVVDSDIAFPSPMDEIKITLVGPSGEQENITTQITSADVLPITVGFYPTGDLFEPATINVSAFGPTVSLPRRTVNTRWIEGDSRVLNIEMSDSCRDLGCSSTAGQTCIAGVCGQAAIDPETLPLWDGTDPRDN